MDIESAIAYIVSLKDTKRSYIHIVEEICDGICVKSAQFLDVFIKAELAELGKVAEHMNLSEITHAIEAKHNMSLDEVLHDNVLVAERILRNSAQSVLSKGAHA